MSDESNTLADQLRAIADTLDAKHCDPVTPDINVAQAVKKLASVMKKGSLQIDIDWDNWAKKPPEVEFKVRRDYTTIVESPSLAEAINKAIVKAQPADTLDKLAEMMPVEAGK